MKRDVRRGYRYAPGCQTHLVPQRAGQFSERGSRARWEPSGLECDSGPESLKEERCWLLALVMESWLLFANLNCPSLRGWDVGAMPATGGRPEGAGLEGRRSFRMAATVGSGVKEARRGEAGGEPSDPHECEEGTTKERKTHPKGATS